MIKRAVAYARVSTKDQDVEWQMLATKNFCLAKGFQVVDSYIDRVSGATDPIYRPGLQCVMDLVQENTVEAVVIWRLDRLSRMKAHMLHLYEILKRHKVQLLSVTEPYDFSSFEGRKYFRFAAEAAEQELQSYRTRVRAGVQFARLRGKHLGRPPLVEMTPELRDKILSDHAAGMSHRAMAKKYGTTQYITWHVCNDKSIVDKSVHGTEYFHDLSQDRSVGITPKDLQ